MSKTDRAGTEPRLDRRAALARLGLIATAAYVAPSLVALSGARASSKSRGSGGSASYRYRSSCSGGSCDSRVEYRHRHYYEHLDPPPPRPRAEAHIVLPPVEVIIRP